MSERDAGHAPDGAADEPFLGRWSRLKREARERTAQADADTAAVPPPDPTVSPGEGTATGEPAAPVQLPDLDQLDQDSDYSAFLAPGVDADLRKRALRKLFHSPKFNVFDGLDTYRDDFTAFPALGDIVTADMRHQLERAARELAERARDALEGDAPASCPPAAAVAAEATAPPALPAARDEDDAEHGVA